MGVSGSGGSSEMGGSWFKRFKWIRSGNGTSGSSNEVSDSSGSSGANGLNSAGGKFKYKLVVQVVHQIQELVDPSVFQVD
jgi:hypothetical protein